MSILAISSFGRRLLIFVLVAMLAASLGSVTDAKKSKKSLKGDLGSVKKQIRDVKSKIGEKYKEKRTVLGQLESTERRLIDAQSKLATNKLKLMDAQDDLRETVLRLNRTIKELERRKLLLQNRIVDIYQGEDLNYVNVVLGSSDMWTFLTRSYYLEKILESDTVLIDKINSDKAQIEADKKRQEKRVAEISALQAKLEEERDVISHLAEQKREQLKTIEHSKDLYEKALDELMVKSREIENKLQAYYQTSKGRKSYNTKFKGNMIRPCPGPITSPFGYRVHPITKVYKLHTGVDIGAPTGTSIKAAASGTVVMTGWMGAYGYAVVVDHGGGVSTLYGHCSKILCKKGDRVNQGETIARVGSTGYSTGPHLHFEKRVNGKPVNPM